MAKRTVFGRRRVETDEGTFIIELKEDELVVRRLRYPDRECPISFARLVEYAKPQLELNLFYDRLDQDHKGRAMPHLPEGFVVHHKPESAGGDLHAGGEPQAQGDEGREPGVDSSPANVVKLDATTGTQTTGPTDDQLSKVD